MLECPEANIVVNASPEEGRTGSLQIGIMALGEELGRIPSRVLVSPVDRCGWDARTISVLLECKQNTSPVPSGHPLLLCEVSKVLSLSKNSSLRDNIEIAKVNAPGQHMNIDKPADLEVLQ